jgi:S-adenosylmethionine-dependent methyltransferase
MSATLLGVADDTAADPEDLVLAVELEATRRDPYRRLSRLFHLVGRRTRA